MKDDVHIVIQMGSSVDTNVLATFFILVKATSIKDSLSFGEYVDFSSSI